MRIQIRRTRRETYRLHAGRGQCLTKGLTEERVSIVQQKTLPAQAAIGRIGDLATALRDPRAVRLGDNAGNLDTPRGQLNDEEDRVARQARPGPDFNGEEIRRSEYLPMRPQKFLPGRPFLSLRSGFNAVAFEDVAIVPRATW